MKEIKIVVKWIIIILFFPISLLFVAYFKQRRDNKEYYNRVETSL